MDHARLATKSRGLHGGTGSVRVLVVLLCLAVGAPGARAQWQPEPRSAAFWVAGVGLVVGAIVVDADVRVFAASHQRRPLDRLATAVDPLGRQHYLVPSLVIAYLAPRFAGERAWADAALRVGLSYAAADGVESVLKPVIGRHRPDASGRPGRFHPFGAGGGWDSFPSGHTVHAFALAAAITQEAHRPWVAAVSYGAASVVGLQRMYTQAHWASDVVGSAVLATAVSLTTVHGLERNGLGRLLPPSRLRATVRPGAVGFSLSF